MVAQAREHESEDKALRELVEARNQADGLAYQTEKTLDELGDKVPAGERESIQGKITELREAAEGEDAAAIKRLSEELQNAFHALTQQLYAQGQAGEAAPNGNGNGRGPASGEDEGEVVEGEFHEA
jgi:molecular chaperone DnaK